MLSRAAVSVAIWLFTCSLTFAEARTYGAEIIYNVDENVFRHEWEKALVHVRMERNRKAKAGELPLSPRMEQDGIDGLKMILYNKAVIRATCAEEAHYASKNVDDGTKAAGTCTEAKLDEMMKFSKLVDYSASVGEQKLTRCEMKARDYKNELRFTPYEFLRTSDGPKLFDFKLFNECILSDGNQ